MGTLYLVPTPIGNMEDITLRALRVLGEVSLIAAEDTRVTRKLLERHNIHTPLTSYHEQNEDERTPELLARLESADIAVVTDAGMPSISDPGYRLVAAAVGKGLSVVALPGPSAVTTALAVSGLPVDQFVYIGYLPRKSGQRAAALEGLKDEPRTIVAFEAPHRLREALEDIRTVLGERPLAVCRELTKLHEEIFRGAPSEALAHFQDPRGEITLVISGAPASLLTDDDIRAELARLRQQGLSASAAARQAAQTLGLPRSRVYPLAVERQT